MAIIYIISAASGTGKTSLITEVLKTTTNLRISISHTTRDPRPKEQNGKNYYFVSQSQFDEMIKQDAFWEYANIFGQKYGTSKAEVERLYQAGVDIILEIDWQGAQQIRKLFPHVISIFILPPSGDELKRRIVNRKQDSVEVINKRLQKAGIEISHSHEYDYLVINDDFNQAVSDLKSIIQAERCRQILQSQKYHSLIQELIQEKPVID